MKMSTMNPIDLADLLEEEQCKIDEDTGEVIPNPNKDHWGLLLLASQGDLKVKRSVVPPYELGYYIPHWNAYDGIEGYCKEFPTDPQCKNYEV